MTAVVRASPLLPDTMNNASNKRKRGAEDLGRNVKNNVAATSDEDYTNLLQGISEAQDDNTRTAQTALALDQTPYPEPSSFDPTMNAGFGDASQGMGAANAGMYSTPGSTPSKPIVGSKEWQQGRKDMHKEVERRRREVINEGIETIAKIVPGVEKNKGAILQRTAQYIGELQGESQKFEQERATLDMAIKELTSRNERLKASVQQAWSDSKKWQKRCQEAGLQFDDYDDGGLGLDADDFGDAGAS